MSMNRRRGQLLHLSILLTLLLYSLTCHQLPSLSSCRSSDLIFCLRQRLKYLPQNQLQETWMTQDIHLQSSKKKSHHHSKNKTELALHQPWSHQMTVKFMKNLTGAVKNHQLQTLLLTSNMNKTIPLIIEKSHCKIIVWFSNARFLSLLYEFLLKIPILSIIKKRLQRLQATLTNRPILKRIIILRSRYFSTNLLVQILKPKKFQL